MNQQTQIEDMQQQSVQKKTRKRQMVSNYTNYEKVGIHRRNIEEKNWWGTFEEVSSPSTYFQSYFEERLRDGHRK